MQGNTRTITNSYKCLNSTDSDSFCHGILTIGNAKLKTVKAEKTPVFVTEHGWRGKLHSIDRLHMTSQRRHQRNCITLVLGEAHDESEGNLYWELGRVDQYFKGLNPENLTPKCSAFRNCDVFKFSNIYNIR